MDWIVGNKFHDIADWTFSPKEQTHSDYAHFPNTLDISLLKDGDIIYTQGFYHYKQQLLDIIKDTKKVILISHNCDDGVHDSFILPDNVIKWYAHNVMTTNPRVESIPAGLENDNRDFGVHKKTKMLDKLNEEKNIRNLVYMDHRVWTWPEARKRPYEVLGNKPWVTSKTDEDKVPFEGYLDNLYNHRFAICPRGNGIATHRPWEAMYMNTIPIEIRNTDNRFYTDMPICFINDWEELTEDFLNSEYDRIKNLDWNREMLTFEYWKNKILNSK